MRLIVDYDETVIAPSEALRRVANVVGMGRVSRTSTGVLHYCWCSVFGDIAVLTRRKKKHQKSDSFHVGPK